MFQAGVEQPGCLFLSVCLEHNSELLFVYEMWIERRKKIHILYHSTKFLVIVSRFCANFCHFYNPHEILWHDVAQHCSVIGTEDEENKLGLYINGKGRIRWNKLCITITNTKILIKFPCISGMNVSWNKASSFSTILLWHIMRISMHAMNPNMSLQINKIMYTQ